MFCKKKLQIPITNAYPVSKKKKKIYRSVNKTDIMKEHFKYASIIPAYSESQNHIITEQFGLEETLKIILL